MNDNQIMRNQIHDRYYDATGNVPTEEEIDVISAVVPIGIRALAFEWGWDDTEVREKIGEWISNSYTRSSHSIGVGINEA